MSNEPHAPAILVIFGITGDLAQRKLLPALYHLLKDGLLHEHTRIVGITRQDMSVDTLLGKTELCVLEADNVCDPAVIQLMREKLSMFKMDLEDPKEYQGLRTYLNGIEDDKGMCMNRLYYLAIPPGIYAPIVAHLGQEGLNQSCQHGSASTRLLVEKPFGYDETSAAELIHETGTYFNEDQLFRIDHYLAKETVQNILTFRFNNPIFEAVWTRDHVQKIEIIASEVIDIEGRANFYEQVGALRDLIQSHLLQLLAVVTMEKPDGALNSDSIHAARLALLRAIAPLEPNELAGRAIRGQYKGYKAEVGNEHTHVETFAAVKLSIENKQWQGVPIIIKTGKALDKKATEIRFTFGIDDDKQTNILTFMVQPSEGIAIDLRVKRPGFDDTVQKVTMDFNYERSFENNGHPDAYERVLVDAVRGDHTLFATSQEVMAAWHILQAVVTAWTQNGDGLHVYEKGGNGPELPHSFMN